MVDEYYLVFLVIIQKIWHKNVIWHRNKYIIDSRSLQTCKKHVTGINVKMKTSILFFILFLTVSASADPGLECFTDVYNEEYEAAYHKCLKACEDGVGTSCAFLGILYDDGLGGLKEDDGKAVSYYRKGCEMNAWDGCAFLGRHYLTGTGIERNYYEAAKSFDVLGLTTLI